MKVAHLLAVFAGLAFWPTAAWAVPTLSPIQELNFGSFLIRTNTSQQTVTVATSGSVSYSSGIMSIVQANRGRFQAQDFTPDTDLSISISPSPLTLTCSCGGPDFTVDTFSISPATPHTDALGNVIFNVGAILRTSGDSAIYNGAPYSGTMTITINF